MVWQYSENSHPPTIVFYLRTLGDGEKGSDRHYCNNVSEK